MLKKLLQGHLLFPLILVAGIGGSFQYGFNVSSINANSAYIKLFIAETWAERFGTKLEDTTVKLIWSLVVSIYPIGGLLGTLNAGHLAVKYGRKKVLLFNNLVDILAATIMLLSRMARSFEMIMVGRFLYGINAGIGLNVQSMYLGESSPIKLRGVVSLTRAMFVAFGKVTGQTIGLREVLGTEHRWHFLLAFSGLPALIQLISLPWFPDSPRYLLIDRQDKVLCLDGDFSEEIADMEAEQAVIKGEGARTAREMFRDRSIRWQLITNVMVTVAMQLCGINAVSIIVLVLVLADCEFALTQARFTWMPYCSIFLIFAYIFSYGMGPAGVTAIIPFEIFTQSCRPVAYAINGTFHWLGLFVMGMVFPFIVEGLGPFCFLIFLGDCLVIAVYVFIILPETKGKSILEITAEFQKLNQRRAGPVTLLDGVKFKQNNPEIFIIATKL
uniref:Solute carrier family 2, facilitated glucose transporter member 11-like n=1 Tax=Callorhinchus milii TaxID=7868 RepID=A0A4W3JTS2_CALMI